MKALKIIWGLSLLFVLSTCTKWGKNITVKGKVLNPLTGEGIAGEEVWLIRTEYFQLPGGGKIIKKATTDANGNFELSKFTLSHPTFKVNLSGNYYGIGWWKGNEYASFQELAAKIGKTMKMEYHAVPYGQLHWHYKNVNCEGSTDTMWYQIRSQFEKNFIDIWSIPIVGCADIEYSGSDKEIMGNHIVFLKIKRLSGTTYKYDTVFVKKEGITNFDLFY